MVLKSQMFVPLYLSLSNFMGPCKWSLHTWLTTVLDNYWTKVNDDFVCFWWILGEETSYNSWHEFIKITYIDAQVVHTWFHNKDVRNQYGKRDSFRNVIELLIPSPAASVGHVMALHVYIIWVCMCFTYSSQGCDPFLSTFFYFCNDRKSLLNTNTII